MLASRELRADPRIALALGASAALLASFASYSAGGLPTTWVARAPQPSWAGHVEYAVAIAAMVVAWLLLGRSLATATDDGVSAGLHRVRRAGLTWAAPMLVAMPIGSRDIWAYLGQAHVALRGDDPYRTGVNGLPALFVDQVSARWRNEPTPYGPLWIEVSKASAWVSGRHLVIGMLALRLFAVIGFLLLVWTVPVLASRAGVRPDAAAWLVVTNPLFLVVGVGGGHNDLLMVGLVCVGLVVVTGPGRDAVVLLAAAALVTAAGLVKAPALFAVPFLVPLWLHARPGRSRPGVLARAYTAAAAGVLVMLAVSFAAGDRLEWVGRLGRSNSDPYGWISVVDHFAQLAQLMRGGTAALVPGSTSLRVADSIALVITLVVVVAFWVRAHRDRPMWWLAIALLTVLLLAPTIRPWYFCWPLAIAAAAALPGRWVVAVVAISALTVAGSSADGHSTLGAPVGVATLVLVLAGVWATRRRPYWLPSAQRTSSATG